MKKPLASFLTLFFFFACFSSASGGGGPENVFLVINPQSQDSMTIANHFIQLRQIPAGNVLYLPWDPKQETIDISVFRTQILKPIIEAIGSRRLSGQIDYVVYSCDFPLRIVYSGDVSKFDKELFSSDALNKLGPVKPIIVPPHAKQDPIRTFPTASLTGLTYLWQSVLKDEPDYLSLESNRYIRLENAQQRDIPILGFRSALQFNQQGELVQSNGKSYLLSVILGITWGRGNTVAEILHYLKRSAAADGTHPTGTIYFVKNKDIRSRVRDELFQPAVKALRKLGVEAQIIIGTMPINKKDVQGVVMGAASFFWEHSGSTILPGAICDNFTSYGGVMVKGAQQTPLSEFLRYGAAGSCGTVTEPFAILQKFPLPLVQVHYACGCSLAEAFYQSIYAPYQIMIVGDPLCRPWANIPEVKIDGVKPNYKVSKTITITPSATIRSDYGIDHFELYVNGSRAALCKAGKTLTLDTEILPDGYQEFRVVAVEGGLIQSQGRVILPIITENHGRTIRARVLSSGVIRADNPLLIDVDSPGSKAVYILQNSRVVGKIKGTKGQVKIEAALLGAGPVRLHAIGIGKAGARSCVLAAPIDVVVEVAAKKPTP
ncbi:MAG: TIGR03790 family protein [Thermoguttaceae bacterium]